MKTLLLQLQTDDLQLLVKTIEQIADYGKEAHNAYSQLLSLLQSSFPTVRRSVVIALEKIETPSTEKLIEFLENGSDHEVQKYILWELAGLGDRKAIPSLKTYLQKTSGTLKLYTLWALANLGAPQKIFIDLLHKESDIETIEFVLWLLKQNKQNAPEILISILSLITSTSDRKHIQCFVDYFQKIATDEDFNIVAPILLKKIENASCNFLSFKLAELLKDLGQKAVNSSYVEIKNYAIKTLYILSSQNSYQSYLKKETWRLIHAIYQSDSVLNKADIIKFIQQNTNSDISTNQTFLPTASFADIKYQKKLPIITKPLLEEIRYQEIEAWEQDEHKKNVAQERLVWEQKCEQERLVLEQKSLLIPEQKHGKKLLRKLGELYFKLEKFDEAVSAYKEVLKLDPTNFDVKCKISDCKLKKIELQIKLAKSKNSEQLNTLLQQKIAVEIEEYTMQVKEQPTNHEVRFKLGVALFQGGKYDKSIEAFQHAIKDPRIKISVLIYMGQAFIKKKEFTLAEEQFKNALEQVSNKDPKRKEIMYQLGICYETAGQTENAIAIYIDVCKVDICYKDVGARLNKLKG